MEPSGDQYEYGSRLTGSSWTPSSGPYTPSSSSVSDQPSKQHQHRTYSGGGATLSGMNNSGGMNSVGTPAAAAAIGNDDVIGPTPNSLNARGNGVQFSKAEYKAPNSLQNSLDGNNTASPPPHYDNNNNSSLGRFSEFKSTNQNQNNDDRQRSSQSSGRRGRSKRDQDRHARSDDSNLHYQSYNNNDVNNNNNEDDNMTIMTEQTPLERWERRKERKLKEQRGLSPRPSKNNAQQQQQQQQQRRAVTPTRRTREGASRSVTKDRKTRWSPQEDEDEYYQEYDDFGPTTTTNDTRGRSTKDAHRRDYERSRTRSPSPRRDRRSRSLSRGRGRPDPLGHRESSIGNHENSRVYRDSDNDDDDEGEGFLGDVDTGSHHGSSLSVDYHFDNEQTRHHQHRSRSRSASRHRSRSRSVPRRRSRSRSRTRNVTNGGGKKKSTYADELKSFTESIAAPVVAQQHQQQHQQGILRNHNDRQYKPYSDHHADNNMAIMEQGVPISSSSSASYSHRNNNKSLHLSEIEIEEEEEGSYTDDSQSQSSVRVRHRASDMCRKFTSCNPRRRRNNEVIYSTSSGSSSKSTKKRCMWIALAVCGVCIVGAVLGIYYTKIYSSENIGEGEDDTTNIAVEAASYEPTITLVPSAQPTRATSNMKPNEVAPSEQIIPTHRPHTLRDDMLAEYLSTLTNGLSDVRDTPQYKAKMWLVYEDTLQLHLPYHETSYYGDRNDDTKNDVTNRIKQRYALATLYYAWNMGDNDNMMIYGWLQGDECEFVEHSSESMYGEEEKEQAWEGVGCDDNGMVQALVLDGANLQGEIPPEIGLLSSMENLIIKNNPGLTGTIPHTIGLMMTNLRQLGLNSNALSSTVPKNIFRLEHLVYLNLSNNNLAGTVSWEDTSQYMKKMTRFILHNNYLEGNVHFHELAKIPTLSVLSLSNNLFDGNIETVGLLSSLEYLYLDGNELVGSIPSGISKLNQLKSLNLDENALYGTLPHTIGNLTNLEYLSAKGNTLSGGLPSTMKTMKSLTTLNLADNAMSGNLQHLKHVRNLKNVHLYQNSFSGHIIGEIFTALSNLEVLFLSSNSLSGGIPSDVIGSQRTLKGLYLSDNNLGGGIPQEVCGLYKLQDLFLDTNNFDGAIPSCLGNLSTLRQFYAFKNRFGGNVPRFIMTLPYLAGLGLEQNDLRGGLDEQTCAVVSQDKSLSIWADCLELEGGCECCEQCCSDQSNTC